MKKVIFESNILPDGHLHCPSEFLGKANLHFDVIVTFEDQNVEALDHEIEEASIQDTSDDFLSEEEINYYLGLEDL